MKMFLIAIVLGIVTLVSLVNTTKAETGCFNENVCLQIISQRWLMEDERKSLDSLSLQSVAVRLRLSNESNHEILYLTGLDSVQPLGYRLYRKIGDTQWNYLPKTKERNESLFMRSGVSGNFKYLRLKPNSAIEFELTDWSNPNLSKQDEEHAFSVFIKSGNSNSDDSPIELTSKVFLPLRK